MLTYWVVLLSSLLLRQVATGAEWSFDADDSQLNLQQVHEETGNYPEQEGIQRFECPAGFFRLRRYCYYLSAGTASWRDAHFQCTARNATLAVLNRNGKDKMLRKYLLGDQFSRLERWIGGIYNWRQMIWEWGVTGEKVLFRNFGNWTAATMAREHECMVVDPAIKYKWSARGCFQQKYFICEAPAGRILGRRRKNISDPHAPQNQRIRSNAKNENKRARSELRQQHQQRRDKNGSLKSIRKKNWHRQHEDNQFWAHGIKFGSRPPKGLRRTRLHKKGKHSKKQPRFYKKKMAILEPRIAQIIPKAGEFGTFSANKSPIGPLALAEEKVLFPPSYDARSVFTNEEILIKT
ncbi:uncharacterized protein LOC131670355 isoform X2 [Phymastichus coffea]|uniref:uncharacterized protein LOC131670355 isoform X2 n=1 Tax=Phymastichus coffea TaxID=108790 RepID=UPI00273C7A48|nr:uncharacterized protein LOC131670355 isoform X2 [Phymastichus coffea]